MRLTATITSAVPSRERPKAPQNKGQNKWTALRFPLLDVGGSCPTGLGLPLQPDRIRIC